MARKFPGADVQFHVSLEIAGTGEFEITRRALVRLVSGVDSPVNHELTSTREFLVAMLALVRTFSGVSSLMKSQPFFDREAFLAAFVVTHIRHLTGMRPHVNGQ